MTTQAQLALPIFFVMFVAFITIWARTRHPLDDAPWDNGEGQDRADFLGEIEDKDVMYDHPTSSAGPMDPVLFIRWDAIREHGFRVTRR